tara:strand:+ start:21584 stop:21769 length:186 start_codon:yes stop_codon:yes gene_type:complete
MSNPIEKTHADGTTSQRRYKPGANKSDKVRIAEMYKAGKSLDEMAVQTGVHPEVISRILGT